MSMLQIVNNRKIRFWLREMDKVRQFGTHWCMFACPGMPSVCGIPWWWTKPCDRWPCRASDAGTPDI